MRKKDILFDLDGTLTESGIGITRCVKHAYQKLNYKEPSKEDLSLFIGPPLRDSFIRFGIPEELVDDAIRIFRERYNTIGKFENIPYNGIEEMLKKLQEEGYRMFVATSKPEVTAIEILEHFNLSKYFECIAGATFDSSRETKEEVLSYLLQNAEIQNPLMIGDTSFDVIGASRHHIPCIAVSWGYGSTEEMKENGAVSVAKNPEELYSYIHSIEVSS